MKIKILHNIFRTFIHLNNFCKLMDQLTSCIGVFCYFKTEPVMRKVPDVLVGFIPASWGRFIVVILTIVCQGLSRVYMHKSTLLKGQIAMGMLPAL